MEEEAPPADATHRLLRLRAQCREFRDQLPVEQEAAFDALLRDASGAIRAGAALLDVPIGDVLTLALALALAERLEGVEGRLKVLERSR